jgi:hypothetical protein
MRRILRSNLALGRAEKITIAIFILIVAATVLNYGVELLSTGQIFAQRARIKMIFLPFAYGILSLAILISANKNHANTSNLKIRIFSVLLIISLWFSTAFSLFLGKLKPDLISLLQGLAQVCGFIIFMSIGNIVSKYSSTLTRYWLNFSGLLCFLGCFTSVSSPPFTLISLQTAIFLIYSYLQKTELIPKRYFFVALISLTRIILVSIQSQDLSLAVALVLALNLGAFALTFLSISIRKSFILLVMVILLIKFPSTNLYGLLRGDVPSDTHDVTLTQRAWEASKVLQLIRESLIQTIFGLGPGSYVDMSLAPDRRTLISAGRNIFQVDDAHFLSSWILLKLGFLGLIVFLLLFMWVLKSIYLILVFSRNLHPLDFLMILLATSGIGVAITAGTNLFTNPLTGISFGVLLVRSSLMRKSF